MDRNTRQTFRSLTKSENFFSLNASSEILCHSECPTSSNDGSDQDSRYAGITCREGMSNCFISLRDSDLVTPILEDTQINIVSSFNVTIQQSEPEAHTQHIVPASNICEERLKYSDSDVRQMRIGILILISNQKLFSQMGRDQKCILCVICLIYFLSFCTISAMEPFFLEAAILHNISNTTYSLIFSIHPFMIFCTSPFIGHILPTIGLKFMFVSGVFIFGACNIIFGVLEYVEDDSRFLILCFFVRGMAAVGVSAFSTAGTTFVADLFPGRVSAAMVRSISRLLKTSLC